MRIGVFGGTFDPPHLGHLIVAQEAAELLGLDPVLFVPAARPPHKVGRVISAAAHRVAMLESAIAGNPGYGLDGQELTRQGPSYTVDTLRALRRQHPTAELVLLLGRDQYDEFETWHEPDAVRSLARIAVLRRGPEATSTRAGAEDVPVTRVDISSTLVRQRVRAGLSVRYLIPAGVADYITKHSLYRGEVSGNGTSAEG